MAQQECEILRKEEFQAGPASTVNDIDKNKTDKHEKRASATSSIDLTCSWNGMVFQVLESLLVHLILSNYFDVASIFCMRRVCTLTRRLIDKDQIWEALTKQWGVTPSPWLASAHPCLTKLAWFREYIYGERHIFVNPPIESRYNHAYACEIKRFGFRFKSVCFIEFAVRGDMSLGPLQQPTCSRIDYVYRGTVVNRKRPDKLMLFVSEPTRYEGFMFFDVDFERLFECDIFFQYGAGGFSIEKLCTLNRSFCKKNRLVHFVRPCRWRATYF